MSHGCNRLVQGNRVLHKYGALLPARTLCVDVSGARRDILALSDAKVIKTDRTRLSCSTSGLLLDCLGAQVINGGTPLGA